MQVLEVNPGSDRTGALVTKAVGEATQSCRLARVRRTSPSLSVTRLALLTALPIRAADPAQKGKLTGCKLGQ